MMKLCILLGTTIGSYLGWALGDKMGLGFFGSFIVSGIGSVVGVYGGWKLAKRIE